MGNRQETHSVGSPIRLGFMQHMEVGMERARLKAGR